MRKRDRSVLNGEIAEGAASCTLMHLANICYRLGRSLKPDPATQTVMGDAEAQHMFTKQYRAPFVVPEEV